MNQWFTDIESVASYLDWSGSLQLTGPRSKRRVSLKTVYRALFLVLALARKAHSRQFTLSARQLAELGAGDASEGSRALRALRQLGFLRRLGRKQKEGTLYRLVLPDPAPLPVRTTPLPAVVGDLSTDGARTLRLRGMQVKALVATNPTITTHDIASRLGIGLRAAQRAYKQLRELPPTAFESHAARDKLQRRHDAQDRPAYRKLVAQQRQERLAQQQKQQAQQATATPTPAPSRAAFRPVVPPLVRPTRVHCEARVAAIVTVPDYRGFPVEAVDLTDVFEASGSFRFTNDRVAYGTRLRKAGFQVGDRIAFSARVHKGGYEDHLRYLKDVRVLPAAATATKVSTLRRTTRTARVRKKSTAATRRNAGGRGLR